MKSLFEVLVCVSDCDALVKIHQWELIVKALSQELMQGYFLAISEAQSPRPASLLCCGHRSDSALEEKNVGSSRRR